MNDGLTRGVDGVTRCAWCGEQPDYVAYHDDEWGFPVADDRRLFEKLCLEGFQSGLSWLTILRKREAFRRAFAGFDFARVARFGDRDAARLLGDAGIVRHAGKIASAIGNARRACEIAGEFGSLAAYVWRFEPAPASRPRRLTAATLRAMASTEASVALSKDLKKRGFTFVGPTTAYAFMQAMGLVNDHIEGCAVRPRVERARRAFHPPGIRSRAAPGSTTRPSARSRPRRHPTRD
jgi:DNA-3-methyladenine glycosylase I